VDADFLQTHPMKVQVRSKRRSDLESHADVRSVDLFNRVIRGVCSRHPGTEIIADMRKDQCPFD
jgi:hypothetical protein